MAPLTRDEAVTRAGLVRVRSYQVDLDLSAAVSLPAFTSTSTVRFSCPAPGAETFVEVAAVRVLRATLNGAPVELAGGTDGRLRLTGLRTDNELVVEAVMACSDAGEGLHRFVDPADGEVYLYGNCGLDNAPRVFACFDQPDLKAPVGLTVTAPAAWLVRANGAGERTAPGRWRFAPTPPLATFLFTVVAGPWHARYAGHDGVPFGLFCRRSLAALLDAEAAELLRITGACLEHYHRLFGIRYPFGGHDQVFVPELTAGAVENPGCVTFREEFLFRSRVTEAERELRAVVVAHEMAHMWFGDLVTVRWWDDIWLSESFAEYLGWKVTAEVTRFTGAWTGFTVRRKTWGYAADQRPSTHPVAPDGVADSARAGANFDGISYAKGAAALRQLAAWLGEDVFLAGLRGYFHAHAHGNASLADLLAALSTASGRDLTGWSDAWLRRAQVNTLLPEVAVGPDGRYTSVTVVQTAPATHPTLRPHRIRVGVYDETGALRRRVPVELNPERDGGRTPVPGLTGVEAGPLLLVNDGDLTFAKVRLDAAGRAALPDLLPRLADPLARALVWVAAADATRDGLWSPPGYLRVVRAALPAEPEPLLLQDVLGTARTVATTYLPVAGQAVALAGLAEVCRQVLATAPPGGDRQLAAARGLAGCAGADDVAELAGWLAGVRVPAGLPVDTELRWLLLYRLVVLGAAGEPEIDAEVARDASAHGLARAARCRAALPDPAAKAHAWWLLVGAGAASPRLMTAVADGFWQPEQAGLTGAYVARYFADVPVLAARRPSAVAAQVAELAFPRYAVSAATLAAAEAMLTRTDLPPVLARAVGDRVDELRRALRAH
jgi:aminopeptidase N